MSAAFFLVHHESKTLISNPSLGIRIQVYNLSNDDFQASNGRMDFYGVTTQTSYAFVSDYAEGHQLDHITDAIQWYASYIQCPGMTFSLMDPRKHLPLSV